jgi:hypothetical protein
LADTPDAVRRARGSVGGATTWHNLKPSSKSAARLAQARRTLELAQAAAMREKAERLRQEADALAASAEAEST